MNVIVMPYSLFSSHKERFKAVSDLEGEMHRKYKGVKGRRNYRIMNLENCIMCEYKDLDRVYY